MQVQLCARIDGAQGKNKPEELKEDDLFKEPEEFKQDNNKEKLTEAAIENPAGGVAAFALTISINWNYLSKATSNDQSWSECVST